MAPQCLWTEVFQCTPGTARAGAEGLISCLRNYFSRFGIPEELSSDGGPEFAAAMTKEFLSSWGVQHRISSAYNPQSNGRAEVAVKSAKRLLRSNMSPSGTLNSDAFLQAMLVVVPLIPHELRQPSKQKLHLSRF